MYGAEVSDLIRFLINSIGPFVTIPGGRTPAGFERWLVRLQGGVTMAEVAECWKSSFAVDAADRSPASCAVAEWWADVSEWE